MPIGHLMVTASSHESGIFWPAAESSDLFRDSGRHEALTAPRLGRNLGQGPGARAVRLKGAAAR